MDKYVKIGLILFVVMIVIVIVKPIINIIRGEQYRGKLRGYEIIIFHNTNDNIDEITVGYDDHIITEQAKGYETVTFVLDASIFKKQNSEVINYQIKSGTEVINRDIYYYGHADLRYIYLEDKIRQEMKISSLKDRLFYIETKGMVIKKVREKMNDVSH